MFKKIILPLGLLLAGVFLYRGVMLFDRIKITIQKIKFDFSFIKQNIILTLGIYNPTSESGLLEDLFGKVYFIDNNKNENYIADVSLDNMIIKILPKSVTFADFKIKFFAVGLLANISDLIIKKRGSIKFVGYAKAFGVNVPINYTYKLI